MNRHDYIQLISVKISPYLSALSRGFSVKPTGVVVAGTNLTVTLNIKRPSTSVILNAGEIAILKSHVIDMTDLDFSDTAITINIVYDPV